jgi:hypothetical protein
LYSQEAQREIKALQAQKKEDDLEIENLRLKKAKVL